jgi:RNA polymerase sigma factor (sigma-70 family)
VHSGSYTLLTHVFQKYKREFVGFIQRSHHFSSEQIEDAFVDAILILRLNILANKITSETSSVKTYLFAVGKNLLMEEYRRESKYLLVNLQSLDETQSASLEEGPGDMENIPRIRNAFSKLSPGCQKILLHLYFHGWSYQDIQEEYKNLSIDALRVRRVKCINQLKKIFYETEKG